jgi:DNA-directed RNA polymerase subunit alpha
MHQQSLDQYPYMNPTFLIDDDRQSPSHSYLTIGPLEKGYGHTLGNALRRVLLTSLPGAAITRARIEGAEHQFSSIEGVKEDVIEILLNLKQIRIKADTDEPGTLRMNVTGPGKIMAQEFECEAGFVIINSDQHIVHLEEDTEFELEATVESGLGYLSGEEVEDKDIGEIVVDAIFSPVVTVSYKVEQTRVGRRTDYDQLLMDVKTDGTISPLQAVQQAAQILHSQFEQVFDPVEPEVTEEKPKLSPEEAETLRLTVEELDLPTRIANALRRGGYKNVGDLVEATEADVSKVKNIGEKSINLIQEALNQKGVGLKE